MSSLAPTELFSLFAPASWRAAWLIVVLIGLRRLVRGRIPAQVWFAAWLVVALRLLLPFSIPVAWSPYNLAAMAPARVAAQPAVMPTIVSAPALAKVIMPAEVSAPPVRTTEIAAAPVEKPRTLPAPAVMLVQPAPIDGRAVAALVWIAGVILIAAGRLLAAGWFRRQLAPATPLDDGRVAAVVAEESQRHGRAAAIPSFETDAVDAPALYGIVRPRLLFPPGFARQLDDAELRLVVRHELAHWRRRDLLAQALLQAAVTLHWFNPLAWIAAKLARLDCELACDEFVLRRESRDGVSAYGATLLKVLGVVRGRRRPGAVVAIIEGRQQLAQRVRLIADYRGPTLARVAGGVALVAALTAASLTRESHAAAAVAPAAPIAPATLVVSTAAAASPAAPAAPELDVEGADSEVAVQKLGEAVAENQKRAADLARELSQFKQQHDLASLDQKRDMITAALKLWNAEVLGAQQTVAELELRAAQVKEYQRRGDDLATLPFVASQPAVAELKRQVMQKRVELGLANETYLERHPKVQQMTHGLAQVTEQLKAAVDAAIRQNAAELQVAVRRGENAGQKFAAASREALEFDRLATTCQEKERELRRQTEQLEALRARWNELRQRYAHARLQARQEAAPREITVSVLGAVRQQGALTFAAGEKPILLDVIARAGGFSERANRAGLQLVRTKPDGSREALAFTEAQLTDAAGLSQVLQRGDVVVVPEIAAAPEPGWVSILGAVASPGQFALPPTGKMNLVDLLARAGGGTRLANYKLVVLKRVEADGAKQTLTVNAETLMKGDGDPNAWVLRPGDIVTVPERTL